MSARLGGEPLRARFASARDRLTILNTPDSPGAQRTAVVVLGAITVVLGLLAAGAGAQLVPPVSVLVPVLFGGFTLRLPLYRLLSVLAALMVAYDVAVAGIREVRVGSIIVIAITALIGAELSRTRQLVGVSAIRRESMLIELVDQLRSQSDLPPLPGPWHAEVVQRSAGGVSFGGDFLVSAITSGGTRLELVLVDVSGKGVDAGTRAVLLSGALGGLLGSVPPERFLPAANDYLLRQGWGEGFATALHLALNLRSGEYHLECAGHPPAAFFSAGSGRWRLAETQGLVLGVAPILDLVAETGVLRPYDALLLYTDGLVEIPGRDLALGIDRLVGEAERLIPRGFEGGAERLIDSVAPHASDDRALILIWRA